MGRTDPRGWAGAAHAPDTLWRGEWEWAGGSVCSGQRRQQSGEEPRAGPGGSAPRIWRSFFQKLAKLTPRILSRLA